MKTTLRTALLAMAVFFLGTAAAQTVDFGKSYINVSKGLNGGTVEPGDTLEIRSSISVRAGTFDSCAYYDVVPIGTSFVSGSIRVLTNEGKIYKQFTDLVADDCGWIAGSNIRINLGYSTVNPASATKRGRVANTHKPSFYGSSCIMIASFRVIVTAPLNSTISTGGGSMTYQTGTNPIQTFFFPANLVRVYKNYGICSNSIGVNAIGTEFNGTFGSGKPRNRGSSTNVPAGYSYTPFDVGTPNDYAYGIANNTSTRPNYTTLNTWAKPDNTSPTHRVFNVWDIIGDHTGAVSPTLGNPAADTVANPNAGYMLVINAAYRIDSAFQQTISGLCPNTYYEISCWMRNICSKCGCDSNGKGATNSTGPPFYIPTAAGDSSGVYPNLTFEVDGIDYYTTGNIRYTGEWVKKGFTFLTGASQTSFTLKFFNNAPGGGGNDWALDDISVATCSPNMKYSPSVDPYVCMGNALTIYDTVHSFFNNYTYYIWQRSTDNGATWLNISAPSGPSSPVWNGTDWQYVTSYTIPPANTTVADSADLYRVLVATTLGNLSNSGCRFTDVGNIITLHVIDCGLPLGINLLNFSGNTKESIAKLAWTMGQEHEAIIYTVERSLDGIRFEEIGQLDGHNDIQSDINPYTFDDVIEQGRIYYYRIRLNNLAGASAYTKTIMLATALSSGSYLDFSNPFGQRLAGKMQSAFGGTAVVELLDMRGNVMIRKMVQLLPGSNIMDIGNTGSLPAGAYILHIKSEREDLKKILMKQNF